MYRDIVLVVLFLAKVRSKYRHISKYEVFCFRSLRANEALPRVALNDDMRLYM